MKLPLTENFIKKGIKLYKKVHPGGFFTDALYEYKTVYDLNEAISLSNEGWYFSDQDNIFHNISLFTWRDLLEHKCEPKQVISGSPVKINVDFQKKKKDGK